MNVTDTGIGISADDLSHIFQKFYRADNSDTRTIGGTGLGLYLVKQRVEAMGGKVWAESAFGEGSTFYVSLPRLTNEEYEKRMIAVNNSKIQAQLMQANNPAPAPPLSPVLPPQPASATPPTPTLPPQPASATPPTPTPPPQTAPTPAPASPQPAPALSSPPGVSTSPPPAPPATSQINNNLNGEAK
ncbi:hypothetical protein IKF73_00705 [Candidatus Saccharibacteria bacterium]|nr:hypothetical protein [Candidatus Saccharibacteria bacterium]